MCVIFFKLAWKLHYSSKFLADWNHSLHHFTKIKTGSGYSLGVTCKTNRRQMSWQLSSKLFITGLLSSRPPLSHCSLFLFVSWRKVLQNRLPKFYLEGPCMGTFAPQQVSCPVLQAEGIVHFSLSLENLMASSRSLQRENKWCVKNPVCKTMFPPFGGLFIVFSCFHNGQNEAKMRFYRSLSAWRHSLFPVLCAQVLRRSQ